MEKKIARPYAKALFALAQSANDLAGWKNLLEFLVLVLQDKTFTEYILQNSMSSQEKAKFIISLVQDKISKEGQALVYLLCRLNRLNAVPQILNLYNKMVLENEGVVECCMVSSTKPLEPMVQKIKTAIEQKLAKKVRFTNITEDPALISGVVVDAVDKTFDLTIKGQLQRLYNNLIN